LTWHRTRGESNLSVGSVPVGTAEVRPGKDSDDVAGQWLPPMSAARRHASVNVRYDEPCPICAPHRARAERSAAAHAVPESHLSSYPCERELGSASERG
jgi:hypothetical protein